MRLNTNNKIPFFPFIFQKDFFGLILILCLYLLETHYGISSFSAGILYVAWRLYPPRWPGLTSSYKRFPLPSSFQLLTECITFYSLPNWDFRIVGFKENIFSITSIFLVMLLGHYIKALICWYLGLIALSKSTSAFFGLLFLLMFTIGGSTGIILGNAGNFGQLIHILWAVNGGSLLFSYS